MRAWSAAPVMQNGPTIDEVISGGEGLSERNDLIRHVAGERLVEVREAADRHAFEQLVGDLTLVAALVASHQQDAFILGDLVQPRPDRVAVDQDIIIVLEEKHADHVDAVPVFLELRQNHLGKHVGDVVALGGEDVGDFHSGSSIADGRWSLACASAARTAATASAARARLSAGTPGNAST